MMENNGEMTYRPLATIQRITNLRPIPGADKIVLGNVLGWEVVVKKDEFKEGDYCVYFEIDSLLPPRPEYEFMRERKFRVRTIKLKGQVSQGLCLPLHMVVPVHAKLPELHRDPLHKDMWMLENDVTELLGVRKYVSPTEQQEMDMEHKRITLKKTKLSKFLHKYQWYRALIARITGSMDRKFPSFIKKTDEIRIQSAPELLKSISSMRPLHVTEKIDGQSATYFMLRNTERPWWAFWGSKYVFGVCSRNLLLTTPDNSSWWTIAKKKDIRNILMEAIQETGTNLVFIQGEIIGPGIQQNKYHLKEYDFYLFNLYLHNRYMSATTAEIWCAARGLNHVPILKDLADHIQRIDDPTVAALVNASIGYSVLDGKVKREGIIVRAGDSVSFKVINPEFLLKYEGHEDEEAA